MWWSGSASYGLVPWLLFFFSAVFFFYTWKSMKPSKKLVSAVTRSAGQSYFYDLSKKTGTPSGFQFSVGLLVRAAILVVLLLMALLTWLMLGWYFFFEEHVWAMADSGRVSFYCGIDDTMLTLMTKYWPMSKAFKLVVSIQWGLFLWVVFLVLLMQLLILDRKSASGLGSSGSLSSFVGGVMAVAAFFVVMILGWMYLEGYLSDWAYKSGVEAGMGEGSFVKVYVLENMFVVEHADKGYLNYHVYSWSLGAYLLLLCLLLFIIYFGFWLVVGQL